MMPRSEILAIAPTPLPNRRSDRYVGADGGIGLSELDPEDLAALHQLYEALQTLYTRWLEERPISPSAGLVRIIRSFGVPPLSELADGLGDPTRRRGSVRWAVQRAIHDLRGGALFALRLYGGLPIEELDADEETVLACVFLARDQAKIIRNILPELDPEGRARDETEKHHEITDVLEKWSGFRLPDQDGDEGGVRVRSEYLGPLASCCLEASTVDRVLFNLLNNALRFGAGRPVDLQVVPVKGEALRWVVSNALTRDQREWLEAEVPEGGIGVFRAGLTRGGEGTGLASCAEFVSAAFGLGSAESALEEGYLGARWGPDRFDSWFHWPILRAATHPETH